MALLHPDYIVLDTSNGMSPSSYVGTEYRSSLYSCRLFDSTALTGSGIMFSLGLAFVSTIVSALPSPYVPPNLLPYGVQNLYWGSPNASLGLSRPKVTNESWSSLTAGSSQYCGPSAQFTNATQQDWMNMSVDTWLAEWWRDYSQDVANSPGGFVGAFALWAIGDSSITCQEDGSSSCVFQPCGNPVLNNLDASDMGPAYMVMKSIVNLHSYFHGLRDSFVVSSFISTFLNNDIVGTFLKTEFDEDPDQANLANIFRTVGKGIVRSIGSILGSAALSIADGPFAVPMISLVNVIGGISDDTNSQAEGQFVTSDFSTASQLASTTGEIIDGAFQSIISVNNDLMKGSPVEPNQTKISDFVEKGSFLNTTIDEIAAINSTSALLLGQAINQFWLLNRIFIIGGDACDNPQLGPGPRGYTICKDGKRWAFYWWVTVRPDSSVTADIGKIGYMTMPPGADKLGQGLYLNITLQDVMSSSLDLFAQYPYNYANRNQSSDDVRSQLYAANWTTTRQALNLTGTFTLPVCDISSAINADPNNLKGALDEYATVTTTPGTPVGFPLCGPVCGGDAPSTQAFKNILQISDDLWLPGNCEPRPVETTPQTVSGNNVGSAPMVVGGFAK